MRYRFIGGCTDCTLFKRYDPPESYVCLYVLNEGLVDNFELFIIKVRPRVKNSCVKKSNCFEKRRNTTSCSSSIVKYS